MQKALANYNFCLPQFLGQMVHRYSKNKLPGNVFKSLHDTFDRRFGGYPQLFQTFVTVLPNRARLPSPTHCPIHYSLTTLSFDEMYSRLLSASLNKQQTKHRKCQKITIIFLGGIDSWRLRNQIPSKRRIGDDISDAVSCSQKNGSLSHIAVIAKTYT
jgi:hypothetical protein